MKILVLMKCVPDTETRIKPSADGRAIDDADIKWVVNPYDEYAVEEGLKIAEAVGNSEVIVLSLGDDTAQPALRQCLAMGADRAVLLSHPAFAGSDGIATARALAAAARKIGFDLILAGKQGVGHDRGQVGVMVAERLDLPHVSVVTKIELGAGSATCWREIEGGQEVVETSLPALITAQKGLNEPRYPKLKGIMAAKQKPVDTWGPDDIGVGAETVGAAGAAESWSRLEPPPPRPSGQRLQGDPAQVAAELVRLLSEEAKVI